MLGVRPRLARPSRRLARRAASAQGSSTRKRLAASALLISTNWLVYVWSVENGHVVESSLGYFINPLVNVLLGVVVLRERLNRVRWCSVALAAAGVAYLTWLAGRPPWIALTLATSFGSYGLLRKTVAVDALVGLGAETLLVAPFGAGYLLFLEVTGHGAFSGADPFVRGLLLVAGPLTAIPLALFAFGARRVSYSTVGIVQYIGPTMQLVLGIRLFHESFTRARAVGFACIWAALALYVADSARGTFRRKVRRVVDVRHHFRPSLGVYGSNVGEAKYFATAVFEDRSPSDVMYV